MAIAMSGGVSAMDTHLFGDIHSSVMRYTELSKERASHYLNEAGQRFMDAAEGIYKRVVNTSAYRIARAALNRLDVGRLPNRIQELRTLVRLQNAPERMIPWIMCEPETKQRWLKGRCEGFGSEYVDVSDGEIGDRDALFRAVYSGVMANEGDWLHGFDKDIAEQPNWGCWCYFDEKVDALDLSDDDQFDILATHDAQRVALTGVDDFTSRYNASL